MIANAGLGSESRRDQPWAAPQIYPLGLADGAAGGTGANADGFAGSMSFPTTSSTEASRCGATQPASPLLARYWQPSPSPFPSNPCGSKPLIVTGPDRSLQSRSVSDIGTQMPP